MDTAHIEGFEPVKCTFRRHPKSELLTLHLMRDKLAVQGHLNCLTIVQDFYSCFTSGPLQRCINPNGYYRCGESLKR